MDRITVVTSGKGGAGKSTVSAGLGCALASAGARVLLIDGDAGLRSLDLMLGIGQQIVYDLSDVAAGNCEPESAIYSSEICPRLSLLPAPTKLDDLCGAPDIRDICRKVSDRYDFILIDCPAGTGAGFLAAVEAADRALVVTTPDAVCARDAGVVGDMLWERQIPARLIINRLRVTPVLQGKMPDIDTVIDTAKIQLIGVIPEDEHITVAGANGLPLPDRGIAVTCFDNIARRLCGEDIPLADLQKT